MKSASTSTWAIRYNVPKWQFVRVLDIDVATDTGGQITDLLVASFTGGSIREIIA